MGSNHRNRKRTPWEAAQDMVDCHDHLVDRERDLRADGWADLADVLKDARLRIGAAHNGMHEEHQEVAPLLPDFGRDGFAPCNTCDQLRDELAALREERACCPHCKGPDHSLRWEALLKRAEAAEARVKELQAELDNWASLKSWGKK